MERFYYTKLETSGQLAHGPGPCACTDRRCRPDWYLAEPGLYHRAGFAGKKKHGKKRESLFSSGKRCIYCDTKFRATGRKIICVTQTNRFSIRNTFCFRAVLLRPWSRAPSLSSRPKNARFACRYRPGVCTCSTRVHVLHPGGLHAGPRAISNLVETQRSAGRKTNS